MRCDWLCPLQASTVIPSSQTYHLGFVRDEETLEASMYLNKVHLVSQCQVYCQVCSIRELLLLTCLGLALWMILAIASREIH